MLISLVRDARPTAIWRVNGRCILARLLPQLLSEILVTEGEHAAVGVMDDDVLIGVGDPLAAVVQNQSLRESNLRWRP